MGTLTVTKQSAASVPLPPANQLKLFVDSADDTLKTKDSANVVRPSGVGTADELATTGAPVDVSAAVPPATGQVLTATSPTTAVWQGIPLELTNTAVQIGPTSYNAAVGDFVPVNVGAGAVTVNLPAGHAANDVIGVKLVSNATFSCTVDADAGELIDGALTQVMSTNFEWAIFRSDGTNWMQIS